MWQVRISRQLMDQYLCISQIYDEMIGYVVNNLNCESEVGKLVSYKIFAS